MQFYLAWTWKVLLMPQASEAWKPLQKNCSWHHLMSPHCKEAERLKNFHQESPAQGGTESSPTLYELIPSEEKKQLKLTCMLKLQFRKYEVALCAWDCNSNTLSVRSALGKEIGLRLMPGCRWLERSIGILWLRAVWLMRNQGQYVASKNLIYKIKKYKSNHSHWW